MEPIPQDQSEAILDNLRGALSRAEVNMARLRRRRNGLVYVSLLAGLMATVVSGFAAAIGPMVGGTPKAWKMTCGVVAALTACATFCSGLNERFGVPDQLAKATVCVGRLRTLEIGITLAHRDPSDVARDYQELIAQYQDVLL
jgi:hypothetical protein